MNSLKLDWKKLLRKKNFGKIYTVEDIKKIEQLMQQNESSSKICEIMGTNADSFRKIIENINKIEPSINSHRQNS